MFSQIADLLIRTAFGFFVYALLLRFYMQALRAPFRNPVGQFVTALTPVFAPPPPPFYAFFRAPLPPIGNVDLSPLFVLLLAQIILILLESVARLIQAPL